MKKIPIVLILLSLALKYIFFAPIPTADGVVSNYVQTYKNSEIMTMLKEKYTEKGVDVTVLSQGTTIVFRYQYIDYMLPDPYAYDQLKSQLQGYIDATETQQKVNLEGIKSDCQYVTSIRQEFYDYKGELLASGEVN